MRLEASHSTTFYKPLPCIWEQGYFTTFRKPSPMCLRAMLLYDLLLASSYVFGNMTFGPSVNPLGSRQRWDISFTFGSLCESFELLVDVRHIFSIKIRVRLMKKLYNYEYTQFISPYQQLFSGQHYNTTFCKHFFNIIGQKTQIKSYIQTLSVLVYKHVQTLNIFVWLNMFTTIFMNNK